MSKTLKTDLPALAEEANEEILTNIVAGGSGKHENDTEKNGLFLRVVLPLITVFLVSIFPVLFLYLNNVTEVPLRDILQHLLIFAGTGAAIFILSLLLIPSHKASHASLLTVFFMLLFSNYVFIESLFQMAVFQMKLWHILPILVVLGILLGWLIYTKLKPSDASKINTIICIIFAGLTLLNIFTAVPGFISAKNSRIKTSSASKAGTLSTGEQKPNVYWLIFDEFSSLETIQKYFDYDNSAFTSALEDIGFTVNYNCYNDSADTATIIANFMSLDYVVDGSVPKIERRAMWADSPAINMALKNGYNIVPINQASLFGLTPVVGDIGSGSAGTVEGYSFKELLISRTPIKDFVKNISNEEIVAIKDSLAYLKNPDKIPEGSSFTFSYMVAPHQPFYFDADGNLNDPAKFHDWIDKQYYLGYYIYMTKQIQEILTSITKNDPNSIIIIQSDHSARYLTNEQGENIIKPIDKTHAFCAVYYQGQPIPEIEGLSGVNVLRTVFSKLYNTSLQLVEVPSK